ncbi:putative glycosyltransferase protein [Stappia aggregata IAM 12614]|uniref:Putative glycosyltransferase protein n=1 Tax=Roseibium aggregatum (strain ATCC 25650 / DSM 13394 / JCM 20685 / NBRC 16684 / NCIMB 2208 / IAM 12614 / B1) TaxID=384765 RepID=A0NNU5_ROSAI|nr:glycosyltransferase family 4 protein [Roseibium aggregatum]EAV45826.1 putative glycosyltransferase protein [Stappia aggregata IAM 12614] [Roseibium aggregatum IAM 12614]
MKLLFVQAGFGAGGTEKIVAMLAAHRAELGDEVHVAAMTCPEAGSYFAYPDSVVLHVLDQPEGKGLLPLSLRRLANIRKLVRSLSPDACLSFLTKINVLTLLAAGSSVPVIASERNNPLAQKAHPVWRRAQNALMPRAAAMVMQTERARQDLPARVRSCTQVIPNPCAPIAGVAPSPDGSRLVAVGRLDHQKGFDLLIGAMSLVREKQPDARLTIYGEGAARACLEAQRDRLGLRDVVSLPGKSTRPGEWIRNADILVLSSRFEGFPNVLAEAAVSGLPVVAFDCPYGPRELILDGENGLLVRDGDVEALARAIDHLISSPAQRAAMAAAKTRLQQKLSPATILALWDRTISDATRKGAFRHGKPAGEGYSHANA